jgi:hypothetical protein
LIPRPGTPISARPSPRVSPIPPVEIQVQVQDEAQVVEIPIQEVPLINVEAPLPSRAQRKVQIEPGLRMREALVSIERGRNKWKECAKIGAVIVGLVVLLVIVTSIFIFLPRIVANLTGF